MTLMTAGFAVAGLLAMAVPILIHFLSRQRRKPVAWAAMRFLLEAYRKHRRRLQIEQLILLALRCLVLAVFGFALARPILQNAGLLESTGDQTVYIVLDNGLASQVTDDDGQSAFDRQREAAISTVEALSPGDRVSVVLAARPAEAVLTPPVTDHGAVLSYLRDLMPAAGATDLHEACRLVLDQIDATDGDESQITVLLASEFRAGSAWLENPLPSFRDRAPNVRLLASTPAATAPANVQVTAIEPIRRVVLSRQSAGGFEQVQVRLARQGGNLDAAVSRVRLTGEGLAPLEPRTVQWSPGQSTADVEFMIDVTAPDNREITLSAAVDRDALDMDNERHVLIDLRDRLRVLVIDRRRFGYEGSIDRLPAGAWIHRALEPTDDGPMELVDVEPAALDVADTRLADVIFLVRPDLLTGDGWSLLDDYVAGGGLLVCLPPGELNVHQWTESLTDTFGFGWQFELEVDEIPSGLAMADAQPASEVLRLLSSEMEQLAPPVRVFRRLLVTVDEGEGRPVLTLSDGTPLMLAGTPAGTDVLTDSARGLVLFMTTTAELFWTNLPSKPLMVPLMHEVVRQGLSAIRGAARFDVGEQPGLQAMYRDARSLVPPSGGVITVNDAGRPSQALREAGVYTVRDRGAQPMGLLAVNVDASAGDVRAQSAEDVGLWLSGSGDFTMLGESTVNELAGDDTDRASLALWCLILVLVFLVVETVLARWFSHVGGRRREERALQGSVRGTMEGTV